MSHCYRTGCIECAIKHAHETIDGAAERAMQQIMDQAYTAHRPDKIDTEDTANE